MWPRRSSDHRANDLLADISDQLDRIGLTLNRIEECLLRIEYAEENLGNGEATQDLSAFTHLPRSDPPAQQS